MSEDEKKTFCSLSASCFEGLEIIALLEKFPGVVKGEQLLAMKEKAIKWISDWQ